MKLCKVCEELYLPEVENDWDMCAECTLDTVPDNDEYQGWDMDNDLEEYTDADAQRQLDNMPAEDYPWADEDLPF